MGGLIEVPYIGGAMVCTEESCPYEKGCLDESVGLSDHTGEPIYLRGLKTEED